LNRVVVPGVADPDFGADGRRAIQSGNVAWRAKMHGVVQSVSDTPTVGIMPSSVEVDDGYRPGLEGVVAFRTEIAEPDRDGGALRYRGVNIEDLVGRVSFGDVWSLLVDGRFGQGLPPAEPFPIPVHTGDVRVDVQAALAMLAPIWGYQPLLDVSDDDAREQLARASVMALSYVAQSARGIGRPAVPQRRIDECDTITERFMTRWRGEPDPNQVRAVDAYWVSAAEHGLNASTFTARVIASTGADVAACMSGAIGAMSGPLHGGAPARVLPMIKQVEETGDARRVVSGILDRHERLMGFGHRVYRAEDPRARVLRRTCQELGAERYEVAAALEQAALTELRERRPDRAIETNVEFWAAVILDFAEVPPHMMPAMFTCARTAGWCAHILEQKRTGRLVRPSAHYVGPAPRSVDEVEGWNALPPPRN
jgi:citrate synthase